MSGGQEVEGHQPHLTQGEGLKDGLTIALGYFPIAITFGLLARNTGLTFFETMGFSLVVFAGAAQFVAVGMLASGTGNLEIVLTTLFLNLRHFLMSASLVTKLDIEHWVSRPLLSFFVTDESFSVASFAPGKLTEPYLFFMQGIAYIGWAVGTGLGFLSGSLLPASLREAMGIGLYLMFVALLVPALKKSTHAIILASLGGLVNSLLTPLLGNGWGIIVTVLLVASFGLLVFEKEGNND